MINVVAAFICDDNKILVTKRNKGELKGRWEFPGGKIEKEEKLFDAIKREIKEELNINIIPEKIIHNFIYKYPFDEISLTLIKCNLENLNENIVLNGSHDDYKWVNYQSLEDLNFAPLDRKIVKFLKNYRKMRIF